MSRELASRASIFLVGTGVVGGALLEILRGPRGVDVAGVANRRGIVFAKEGPPIPPSKVGEIVGKPRGDAPAVIDDDLLDALATLPNPVLVDATAAGAIDELYLRALGRGIHVVTANKKPIAGPFAARARLFDPSNRARGARLRYSATVGAGLPVIETAKDLVRTGDQVKRIDCVLSGTLGFLSNAIASGTPLSRAVAIARQRGYTEPDPREDLLGADVARKAVILAREIGATIELDDVDREPFIPRDVLDRATPETLDKELARLDADFAARAERHAKRGEKLVYLARIEASFAGGGIRAYAAPTAVALDHPAATLEGSSALVAFTSARHASDPIVIRGSGAGGAVTAAALLADVFKVTGLA
jgi:aspartokinase/homoserine dehydrogenase 1